MKVEVELEDLETIVFSTSVIKTIEGALQSRKQDPFVKPHLEFTKAHDYLVAVMNSARRSENVGVVTKWDEELSEREIELLKEFEDTPVFEITGEFRRKRAEIDTLAAKGCIRIGQLVGGAVWPGEQRADIKPIAGYALAITQRGKDRLEKVLESVINMDESAERLEKVDAALAKSRATGKPYQSPE